jgi:IPT/TIG domain-containing protein
MAFVGGGWRSGQASDITGAASTATVTVISPTTYIRGRTITMTVTGTGFTPTSIIYAGYNPCATTYDSATQLRCTSFNTTPDNGQAGVMNVGVRKPGEVISGTQPFTAT